MISYKQAKQGLPALNSILKSWFRPRAYRPSWLYTSTTVTCTCDQWNIMWPFKNDLALNFCLIFFHSLLYFISFLVKPSSSTFNSQCSRFVISFEIPLIQHYCGGRWCSQALNLLRPQNNTASLFTCPLGLYARAQCQFWENDWLSFLYIFLIFFVPQ